MLEQPLYDFSDENQQGHPHDLLARLYREIGISAVAAALEVSKSEPVLENIDRKSTRLNSSHIPLSRMPSSA